MSYAIHGACCAAAGAALLLTIGVAQAGSTSNSSELMLAQAPSAPGPGAAPHPGAAPQGGSRAQQIQDQTAELKKQLQITPNQEQQFDAFAQVMRGNAQAMDSTMRQESQNPPKNAVEDLKAIEQLAETQLDGLKKLVPVFQSLYDSLSEQQKKTADTIFGRNPHAGGAPAPAPARPKG